MKIEKIELYVIGPEEVHYTWSHDIPPIFQSNTILKVYTDSNIVGEAGVWNAANFSYDKYTAESLKHLLPMLINKDPLDREKLLYDLRPRVFPQPPGALAVIDNVLWDIEGKFIKKPIYKILGEKRNKIKSYASTVMYETVDDYMKIIDKKMKEGFEAVKFHTWCIPDKDIELAKEARKNFPKISFMLDVENNYDFESSLKVARELEKLEFTWFEAPMIDYELENYKKLNEKVNIKIIPSGNWIMDLKIFEHIIKNKIWKASRTDMAMMGGISMAKEAINISEKAGIDCEIMSWGYTLPSIANLHLMLSTNNCTYYEQPLPYDNFEFGMHDVLRTNSDGYMYAPKKNGLGVEINWNVMKSKTIYSFQCDSNKKIKDIS